MIDSITTTGDEDEKTGGNQDHADGNESHGH
jgi:hypothetical protein